MSKVNIKYTIDSSKNDIINKEVKGILKDNRLTFIDDDCNMTIVLNDNKLTILRDSSEANLELYFKENIMLSGKYVLKSHNMILDVKTNTTKMIINKNKIELVYKLYLDEELTDCFTFIIDWSE